jgi:hypothetical protein
MLKSIQTVVARSFASWLAILAAVTVTNCTETLPGISGTQSLKIELISPTNPGTIDQRLPDTARMVQIKVTALGPQGEVDTSVSRDVAVYAQFLATLTPSLGSTPLASIKLTNGVSATTTIALPPVFGATTLWIEDSEGAEPTYATGTSPALWFRDPFIEDFQRPVDEMGIGALTVSPLQNKQIRISGSRHGANGKLVVTSVFAQGYTVSDSTCTSTSGAPPCVAGDYDHALVFSFSRPKDNKGRPVAVGEIVTGFTGGVAEFNGLTELSFPQTFVDSTDANPARLSPPTKVEAAWFTAEKFKFERNEAAPIEIDGAKLCPLDADYTKFKQWKLATTGDCASRATTVNVISSGFLFDPAANVGKTMKKVIGILRPVSVANFNVWIIFPRDESDIAVN